MSEKSNKDTPISRAVKIAGGQTAMAAAIGCRPQSVYEWVKDGRAPVMRVLAIEKLTKIPRYELRPDAYPVPRKRKAA